MVEWSRSQEQKGSLHVWAAVALCLALGASFLPGPTPAGAKMGPGGAREGESERDVDRPPSALPLLPEGSGPYSPGDPTSPARPPVASGYTSTADATSDWTIVDSPSAGAPLNRLSGVTCVSASLCWAVGRYSSGTADRTLIERWDGASWRVVASPNGSRTQDELAGVTCVSASDCWAVGHSFNNNNGAYETLILRWDGAEWARVASPNNASMFNFLAAVTCVSSNDCWAVGNYYRYNPGTGGNVPQTLIERWDGTSWSVVDSPNGGDGGYNFLTGVACGSASSCFAVGTYSSGSAYQTLIARWDGTSWELEDSPDRGADSDDSLYGVACVPGADCFAVGISARPFGDGSASAYQTLIERWDGRSWRIVDSPNPNATQHNLLFGVTCSSASYCVAVGYHGSNASTHETLVERWDGNSWSVVDSPNTGSTQSDRLMGVACVSASECSAVGYYDGSGYAHTLIQGWNGVSWSMVDSPDGEADPPIDSVLGDVACVSASDCWAVGSYIDPSGNHQTLIERWDGASWTIVRSPNVNPLGATQNNYLTGVTCVSRSDCWAVGRYRSGAAVQTLIQRWDGSAWSIVTSPNALAATDNDLSGVTCVSASSCWAVGSSSVLGAADRTLIERWDGTSWSIVASPDVLASTDNHLRGVTCVSASECWAVGSSSVLGAADRTLIERWDGSSWTIVASPSEPAPTNSYLTDVTCVSASDCWAVGRSSGASVAQTLIERWDGTSWRIVDSPDTGGTQEDALSGIACAAASECWAVGHHGTSGSEAETLVQRWDGSSWTIVASPNRAAGPNHLGSVTCASPSGCWAVGYHHGGVVAQTLVLRYDRAPTA